MRGDDRPPDAITGGGGRDYEAPSAPLVLNSSDPKSDAGQL